MTPNVRIFRTEASAKAADKALEKAGFGNRAIFLASAAKGRERALVESAIDQGMLPDRTVQACTHALVNGQSLVAVRAPFGRALEATDVMDGVDGVVQGSLARYRGSDPAPFSAALGLPVLSRSRPTSTLTRPRWHLSSKFGMGLLSKGAAPFSSLLSIPLLTRPKKGRTSSWGMPLLSSTGAPFSSLFGMTTVLRRKRGWEFSMGLPLLSKDPAPLSNLFGLRTLSKDQ